ncbi:MAG: polysaccharide deacetylase family protein [Acidimicrobiales bacterium]
MVVALCSLAVACTGAEQRSGARQPATTAVPSSAPQVTTTAAPGPTTTVAPPPATSSPTTIPTRPATAVSRGNPNRWMVALTFDAGSDTGFAAQILDTLAAERVTASFGLTGRWAEQNQALVTRIASDGHQLINHTWDHRSFTGVSAKPAVTSPAERRDQLDRTEAILHRLTGQTTRPWFRPPYGDFDASVHADVGAAGYRYNVLWTVDSLGWQGLSAGAIAARCLRGAQPGAIYLFHVGAASQDAAALPAIISALRADGYSFGTVSDVVGD